MGRKPTESARIKRKEIIRFYKDNQTLPLTTIAEVFGCSREYIRQTLDDAGVAIERDIDVVKTLNTLIAANNNSMQRVVDLLDISVVHLWRLRNGKAKASRKLASRVIQLLTK